MKIIEIMLQVAVRLTEMLVRISLDLLVALLKGGGRLIAELLKAIVTARGRQPERPKFKQDKPLRRRRKRWEKTRQKGW